MRASLRLLPLLWALGILTVSLSCRRAPRGGPADAAALRPDVAGEFDEAKAMTFLYGNWDEAKECSLEKTGAKDAPGSPSLVTVEGAYEIPDTSPERVLFITAANGEGEDSHAQAPSIGGVLFEKVPGGWKAVLRTEEIVKLGSYGKPPDGRLVQVGPKRWGVEYTPTFGAMGVTEGGLALIAETGGALRLLLSLPEISAENGGDCDEEQETCYAFDSEVRYVPGTNAEWFDVEVLTTGSRRGENGKAEEFSQTKRFAFDGTRYSVPASARGEKGGAR
jgi:hypothetical protein